MVELSQQEGVTLCKSEGVIYSEAVKLCKNWAATGGILRNYPLTKIAM